MSKEFPTKMLKSIAILGLVSGVGFGGVAAYEAYGTDAPAQAHASTVVDSLLASPSIQQSTRQVGTSGSQGVDGGTVDPAPLTLNESVPAPSEAESGEAFALIDHPLIRGTQPVVKSESESAQETQNLVDSGVVVAYESRENPGEIGNFAVIGHRNSHGAVFNRAPELRLGDTVTVTTTQGVFVYSVIKEAYRTDSDDHSILDTNPLGTAVNDSRALMSLITCGTWLTDHREVVVLELVEPTTE